MLGFEYKYTTSSEIMRNIKLLTEYSYLEYLLLLASITLLFILIYYIVPIINTYLACAKKEKEKNKRKELLKQIVMQKDINDEIEKEINNVNN